MTQSDTLNFLRKNKERWMTTKELAGHLKISKGSTLSNLNKLHKQGLINKRYRNHLEYEWRLK